MAVPPTVPTSFVPRSGSLSFKNSAFDFGGAFAFLGYGAFVLALLAAGGLFAYNWYLGTVEAAKQADLQKAETSIDTSTVESFIRLNTHLSEGKRLLSGHLIFSKAFDLIASLAPTTVRLTSISILTSDAHTAVLSSTGSAASFNALAVFSDALGRESQIKNAVFSGLGIGKNGEVSFSLTANLDQSLTTFSVSSAADASGSLPSAGATATTSASQTP
jgi:hypothetical protein